MNRNQFIRNSLLALCSTLLPEILRPMEGMVKDEGDKRGYWQKDSKFSRAYFVEHPEGTIFYGKAEWAKIKSYAAGK